MGDVLQEIGLSPRESLCYTALLDLGSSRVGVICKRTDIPSSKIYEVLNRLIQRGLASFVIKGKIKHFQAAKPQLLLDYLDQKREKLNRLIPSLIAASSGLRHSVEVYEGQKALFALFTGLIQHTRPREQYLVFSINEENKSEQTKLFFRNLSLRRKEKKVDVKILCNDQYYSKELHSKVKIRYTSFHLPQGITIFRDSVIILTWATSPIAIRIESKEFSDQMKVFFEELWRDGKV